MLAVPVCLANSGPYYKSPQKTVDSQPLRNTLAFVRLLGRLVPQPARLVPALAALGLLAAVPSGLKTAQAGPVTARSDTMPVSQIKRGMKGYGLTVFEGTRPERFDVEVIDVLKNFRPRQDLILIKTKHPRLEVAKVVAGMSGSPIYLDNKMVGAYAYGWSFGAEPVAGVTPIDNMIDDLVRPLPDKIFGWPLKPVAGNATTAIGFAATTTTCASTLRRWPSCAVRPAQSRRLLSPLPYWLAV
jgi:hypothetical protein